jgi:hypothetical protein
MGSLGPTMALTQSRTNGTRELPLVRRNVGIELRHRKRFLDGAQSPGSTEVIEYL